MSLEARGVNAPEPDPVPHVAALLWGQAVAVAE